MPRTAIKSKPRYREVRFNSTGCRLELGVLSMSFLLALDKLHRRDRADKEHRGNG
jgi:hypothetical protein